MKPPTVGPRVGASIAMIPASIVARTRAGPVSNIRNPAEKVSGIRKPPKNPCTTRAAISQPKPSETAQAALAAVKPRTQIVKAPRVDNTRVAQPVSGIATISAER